MVIGGGVVGAATALAARRLGAKVALLERASLAAATGSSRDTARIYCPAAYPDPSYLETGLRALERWRGIEAEAGERLLWPTGVVSVGGFAVRQVDALKSAGLEVELMPDDGGRPRILQTAAGVIGADRSLATLLRLAREAGVELWEEEAVTAITENDDSVEVATARRSLRCATAVVAAGPWTRDLLARVGIELPLVVTRQTVAYFELENPEARPAALIDYEGDEPYALWDPVRGLKAALHQRGPGVDPDDDSGDADPLVIERLTSWVGEAYPGLAAGTPQTSTCLYTNTPDERFIVERRGRIVIASACSGHGFQFAPESGDRAARLALEPVKAAIR
jgi:sarcosine oxidase